MPDNLTGLIQAIRKIAGNCLFVIDSKPGPDSLIEVAGHDGQINHIRPAILIEVGLRRVAAIV